MSLHPSTPEVLKRPALLTLCLIITCMLPKAWKTNYFCFAKMEFTGFTLALSPVVDQRYLH